MEARNALIIPRLHQEGLVFAKTLLLFCQPPQALVLLATESGTKSEEYSKEYACLAAQTYLRKAATSFPEAGKMWPLRVHLSLPSGSASKYDWSSAVRRKGIDCPIFTDLVVLCNGWDVMLTMYLTERQEKSRPRLYPRQWFQTHVISRWKADV